jgi:signal recognition particle GTPase
MNFKPMVSIAGVNGTSKGGMVVVIQKEPGLPIKFIAIRLARRGCGTISPKPISG